jgi:hypothetical protein
MVTLSDGIYTRLYKYAHNTFSRATYLMHDDKFPWPFYGLLSLPVIISWVMIYTDYEFSKIKKKTILNFHGHFRDYYSMYIINFHGYLMDYN